MCGLSSSVPIYDPRKCCVICGAYAQETDWITPEECAVFAQEPRPPFVIPRISHHRTRALRSHQPFNYAQVNSRCCQIIDVEPPAIYTMRACVRAHEVVGPPDVMSQPDLHDRPRSHCAYDDGAAKSI
ncbi:hypothetical protein EVAR_27429_1 [Eumeta japonica]|uniref:Uncharacterized protein n=1 Tax=Eumeta variegata TaxID=151549 RepID=A0A4C1VKK5_EUMVA|nr:hypothetical protein EVAR_27429_1 [Eumeta japonica]